jgi:4-oxalocrotonate tautomerase
MPYVNVKIAKAGAASGATSDQKAQIIKGMTQVLADVLGKDPETVSVVIDEVDTDNWGRGGETLTVRRKKAP